MLKSFIILTIILLNLTTVLAESSFISFVILPLPEENKSVSNSELTLNQEDITEIRSDKQKIFNRITGRVIDLESGERQSVIYLLITIAVLILFIILILIRRRFSRN